MNRKSNSRKRTFWVLGLLGIGLLLTALLACAIGSVNISLGNILEMVLNKTGLFHFPTAWKTADETIIFQIRLPRVVGAALVGAALATAGVLFQGLLRNPLADPYITGTSSGAALGATVAMMLPVSLAFMGFGLVPVLAFIGAIGTVILVYKLAQVGGRTPTISMLLAGFVVSSLLAAIITFFMSVGDRFGLNLRAVFSFLMGHISISNWTQLIVITPLVIGGIIAARFFAMHLNAFSLGEEGAAYVGVEVEKSKITILAIGSLLTAAAVSVSGLIGFVGLVMPHAMRLTLGPDHRLLIPASALGGAIFIVVADLLARVILAPGEIPVGIITSIIGAPFFLYLLRRSRTEYSL